VAVSSQVEIPPVEKEHVKEQAYPLTDTMWEGGAPHNKI